MGAVSILKSRNLFVNLDLSLAHPSLLLYGQSRCRHREESFAFFQESGQFSGAIGVGP